MIKQLFIVVLIPLFSLNMAGQDNSEDYEEAFKLLEVWLEAQKDYENLPAITASVTMDQKTLWTFATGLANREENVNATPSTLFSICSISKLFTSVAIMKLYDDGKLRLDDEVADLLPAYDLKQQYPGSGPITVRSLLTHSSGLPREAGYPYWTGPDFPFPSKDMIDSKLGVQETLYPASTYFQYSNLGLTLLGEIVEQVSGEDYDDFIFEYILRPLGLSDTRSELPESLYGSELAIGYSSLTREREREKVNFFQANGITPAAGFTSNVEDLGKFAAWQFRLLETKEPEILKPATLDYMQRVHWTDPDWKITWGLGFHVYKSSDGSTLVGHNGSCPGYRSSLIMQPDKKLASCVMINASGTEPDKYIHGIRQILKKYSELDSADSSAIVPGEFEEFCGFYNQQPWWDELYITSWKGILVTLDLPADEPGESLTYFKYLDGDRFQRIRDDKEPGEIIEFERDLDDRVISMKRHGNYVFRIENH